MAKPQPPKPQAAAEPTGAAGGVLAALKRGYDAPAKVTQIEKDLALMANELGRVFGEPIKTNLAYILERHEAPPRRA